MSATLTFEYKVRDKTGAIKTGKLDAEIGKAASEAPSRKDGQSQMGELGEKAADLASKAMEAIKTAFRRTPAQEHRPSEPSPSM